MSERALEVLTETPAPIPPAEQHDWAARVTGLVAGGVAVVRDHSLRPATIAATAVMLGLSIVWVAVGTAVMGVVGIGRLFDDIVFGHRMWATYCLFGGIFLLLGLLVLMIGSRLARRAAG